MARPQAVTDEGAMTKDVVCSPPHPSLRRAGPVCPAYPGCGFYKRFRWLKRLAASVVGADDSVRPSLPPEGEGRPIACLSAANDTFPVIANPQAGDS